MPYADLEKRRAVGRQNYERNKDAYARRRKAAQERFVAWYNALKIDPCADCEETYPPVCMQWDHLPGEEKVGNISQLVRNGNKTAILREIAKCELVCANCHAIRTADRLTQGSNP